MSDSFGEYLASIGRVRLLTADEEISLGHKIQDMLSVKNSVPEDDWSPAQKRIVRRGERAKAKMIQSNLRLVVSCAKKYIRLADTLDLEDLIQEGNFGLMRATEKYDPTRGYKFSTYAYWWIRQAITRGMSQQGRVIRLPCNASTQLTKARTYMLEYKQKHGKLPTIEEIAAHCGSAADTMKHYLQHIKDVRSLNTTAIASDSDSSDLIDLIADPDSFDDDDIYKADADDIGVLRSALSDLDEKTRQILIAYYGLTGEEPLTHAAIAREKNLSRESTRQHHLRALRRLRRVLARDEYLGKMYA